MNPTFVAMGLLVLALTMMNVGMEIIALGGLP